MILFIDEPWLLDLAQTHLPGDPDVVDWGALTAAVARHRAETMGTAVYPEPHHRAAALLHSLVRVPAMEHSNQLFAASAAVAYLAASGRPVKVTAGEAGDLIEQVDSGTLDVRQVAAALRGWTES
ncbi:fic family toxin-antitoxin system, toxin component [Streptomyces sp. H10-C2]|uniref:fic family toxin-antitoxin system, toxin component n=1 Tax=unclassified Streptomyces TaxID=2593676 RepID=UPI0024B9B2A7|nr:MULTISPECIES: fic family toxin-antitoxin system, toxin component [unclassified Streptomyces]MDJ0345882.1 fic family toxin-antitoxin system, toxin component [Streptomyces sp. PH10-H1]MDJ0374731.1 fic family toxin-antitoxin system, toxin component [Streptomyces sp. H10-C2]